MTNPFQDFGQNLADTFSSNPIIAILDILIFATILFCVFSFLKKNNATRLIVFFAPLLALIVFLSHETLGFTILSRVLLYFVFFIFFGAILLFPQQFKRLIWRISASKEARESFSVKFAVSDMALNEAIENIVKSSINMAKKNIGALIVIAPEGLPSHILESGTTISGKVSSSLLETIFTNKTPLHDGAVIIQGNQILSASCFLPLSHDNAIDKELGSRHRAGMGITENHKAFSIIVSEESGVISVAQNGELTRYLDSDMLKDILQQLYGLKIVSGKLKNIKGRRRVKGRGR
ncbi:MAG: diadenylate cyclase CdaA [Firmicutes bacterium]|nr:diadenylate cyclase CdaA [Bacillota bacterium]